MVTFHRYHKSFISSEIYQLVLSAIFYIFSFAFRGFPSAGWIFSLPVVKLSELAGRKTLEKVGNTVKRLSTCSKVSLLKTCRTRGSVPSVLLIQSESTKAGHRKSLEIKPANVLFLSHIRAIGQRDLKQRPAWKSRRIRGGCVRCRGPHFTASRDSI